ncbi:acidic leucine-rich nuclear phosphoprotein 32-related protein 1-like isoform X2 [Scophthalmus maximus]|uniref:acidic leucine-rich nuclear phosphoprotein 32-related protein 1-like isoform X2 n=1 Tax=Scophthalmus maximus TaxID=52904 RepID=UPI001FA848F8|nr:acidic leucine-rich nuclear phosphoprotein 32-related protein 1-like isoform X2 [Scophthalmus maximus]
MEAAGDGPHNGLNCPSFYLYPLGDRPLATDLNDNHIAWLELVWNLEADDRELAAVTFRYGHDVSDGDDDDGDSDDEVYIQVIGGDVVGRDNDGGLRDGEDAVGGGGGGGRVEEEDPLPGGSRMTSGEMDEQDDEESSSSFRWWEESDDDTDDNDTDDYDTDDGGDADVCGDRCGKSPVRRAAADAEVAEEGAPPGPPAKRPGGCGTAEDEASSDSSRRRHESVDGGSVRTGQDLARGVRVDPLEGGDRAEGEMGADNQPVEKEASAADGGGAHLRGPGRKRPGERDRAEDETSNKRSRCIHERDDRRSVRAGRGLAHGVGIDLVGGGGRQKGGDGDDDDDVQPVEEEATTTARPSGKRSRKRQREHDEDEDEDRRHRRPLKRVR